MKSKRSTRPSLEQRFRLATPARLQQRLRAARPLLIVDPGREGAFCFYLPPKDLTVWAIRARDVFEYAAALAAAAQHARTSCDAARTPAIRLVIEQVHAMPRQGVTSSFTFGLYTGAAQALLYHMFQSPPEMIPPSRWKGDLRTLTGLQQTPGEKKKDSTFKLAEALIPDLVAQLSPQRAEKNHNVLDVLLMWFYTAFFPAPLD